VRGRSAAMAREGDTPMAEQAQAMGGKKWGDALRQRDFAAIADWFTSYFFGVAALALVLVGIAAGLDKDVATGFRVFVLSLMLAAASTACGWLLGLLFGVPRTLARAQAAPAASAAGATPAGQNGDARGPSSRVNTNLEDISDWLTKTMVGVGLTQLFTVPGYLWRIAGKLNESGLVWTPYGQLLALSVLLYFAPGGFWLGYVGTRTILTKLFDTIDGVDIPAKDVAAAAEPANLRLDPAARGVEPPDSALAAIDRVLLRTPMQALQTPQQFAAWGAAQARDGKLQTAQTALEQALKSDPANRNFKEQLATVYAAQGKRAEAEPLVREVPNTDVAVFHALYEPPPQGFQKAIAVGEELLMRPEHQTNASLHAWLAAAYGQCYKYDHEHGADAAALATVKAKVLREIEAAIRADSSTRRLLHSLWRPAPGQEDDDLACFAPDDSELTALLGA
jgi:tetratricopeptide (TPR) repeat protein